VRERVVLHAGRTTLGKASEVGFDPTSGRICRSVRPSTADSLGDFTWYGRRGAGLHFAGEMWAAGHDFFALGQSVRNWIAGWLHAGNAVPNGYGSADAWADAYRREHGGFWL
jgi:hypothetical protein